MFGGRGNDVASTSSAQFKGFDSGFRVGEGSSVVVAVGDDADDTRGGKVRVLET